MLPFIANELRVEIKQDAAGEEQDAVLDERRLGLLADLEDAARFIGNQEACDDTRKDAEAAKERFELDDSGDEECFSRDHPEKRDVVAAEFEGHRSEDEQRTDYGEKDECGAATTGDGQLAKEEFQCTERQQSTEGPFGMRSLELEDREKEHGVE